MVNNVIVIFIHIDFMIFIIILTNLIIMSHKNIILLYFYMNYTIICWQIK